MINDIIKDLYTDGGSLIKNNNISASILLFYIFISGSYLGEILPCSLRKQISNSMLFKHILAIITLFLSSTIFSNSSDSENIHIRIFTTLLVYMWFIATTRTPFNYILTILIVIFFSILLEFQLNKYISDNKDNLHNKNYYTKIKKLVNKYALILCILITFIGFTKYYFIKKGELKNDFAFDKFILGVKKCS